MGPVRVTITVMNVNEAPTMPMEQRGGLSVTGRENPMFDEILADDTGPDLMVGTYRGIGVDAADADWSISGRTWVTSASTPSTGELTFDMAPDFENPMDADTDNRYEITVEADDGANTAHPAGVGDGGERGRDGKGDVLERRSGRNRRCDNGRGRARRAVDDSDGNPGDTFPIAMYTRIADANVTSWQCPRA